MVTHQKIQHDSNSIILSVSFYDNSYSSAVTWNVNDEQISTNDTNFYFKVGQSVVTLDIFGIKVRAHGYCTELTFNRKVLDYLHLITCEIRNGVGNITAVFRKSEVEDYLLSTTALYLTSSLSSQNTFLYEYNTGLLGEVTTIEQRKPGKYCVILYKYMLMTCLTTTREIIE